jgi:hypothetical protein
MRSQEMVSRAGLVPAAAKPAAELARRKVTNTATNGQGAARVRVTRDGSLMVTPAGLMPKSSYPRRRASDRPAGRSLLDRGCLAAPCVSFHAAGSLKSSARAETRARRGRERPPGGALLAHRLDGALIGFVFGKPGVQFLQRRVAWTCN